MSIHAYTEKSGGSKHIIKIDAHTMTADLGAPEGEGLTGHDHFDAALAACKGLTAVVYARAKKIPLERVEIHVERDDTKEREGLYKLKVKLEFFGNMTSEEKQRVHNAVSRCPVHKLMTTTTVEIETEEFKP